MTGCASRRRRDSMRGACNAGCNGNRLRLSCRGRNGRDYHYARVDRPGSSRGCNCCHGTIIVVVAGAIVATCANGVGCSSAVCTGLCHARHAARAIALPFVVYGVLEPLAANQNEAQVDLSVGAGKILVGGAHRTVAAAYDVCVEAGHTQEAHQHSSTAARLWQAVGDHV